MQTFAIVALIALIVQYVLALLSIVEDQKKTPVLKWFWTEKKKGKKAADEDLAEMTGMKIVTTEMREMTDIEKRRRFLWFAISSVPAILFLLFYLLK